MFLQKIKNFIKKPIPEKITTVNVSIDSCVHYCGFRYGREEYNPYETYIRDLHFAGKDIARKKFITFLQYYRPHTMAEAVGINSTINSPLWLYPWDKNLQSEFSNQRGWCEDPNDCPDIITHFSAKGILRFRIEQEFAWLENAYYSIKKMGYLPEKYNNFIEVMQLLKNDGQSSFLVLDGNHRISALSVLGEKEASCQILKKIYENNAEQWPGVKEKLFSHKDALAIFNAYFYGNHKYITAKEPAAIIDF